MNPANTSQQLSASVDFLTGYVTINGIEQDNENVQALTSGGTQEQELGYILNINDLPIAGQDQYGLLGIANGTDGTTNNEGLIKFSANYQIGSSLGEFSFMFYAFKEDTYQRTEEINTDTSKYFQRPAPALKTSDSILLEHVTDSATANQYFSEAFYYYANQNLPYLEYDYTRYEINITKTIHSTSTKYNLSYNLTTGEIIQTKTQNLSTADIYAKDLVIEKIAGTTKVRIYFSDLGVYDFTYTAVYYGSQGKVNLATLNGDTRQDRLTIYGTQATYQDIEDGKSAFRSDDNSVSADVTGNTDISFVSSTGVLTIADNAFEIASTNQPPVNLLFNSTVTNCQVYYSATLNGTYTLASYLYTSNLTAPGYYYITVANQYSKYKIWLGSSTSYSTSTTKSQVYFFQIKDQTPSLDIYQLDDDGTTANNIDTAIRIYSGSYNNGNYTGSYAKNGVQILEVDSGSIFDSAVTLTIQYRTFTQTDAQMVNITLPTASASELTANQISYLAGYGITKYDGYYTLTGDGHYSVKLNFGKSGSTSCLFDIDTEEINGIKVYNVETISGSNYYASTLLAQQGTFATTNQAISLLWNSKASGAQISASYVRFDLATNNYLTTLGLGYSYNDYIINNTWVATDYSIVLSGTNPETMFTRATNASLITSSSVLNLDGLYIFKLEDEAGNIEFYSVLVDTSLPTVLQTTENGVVYSKISGINNVSEATKVFFGSHKAISFLLNGQLVSGASTALANLLDSTNASYSAIFAEYYNALFDNLTDLGANNSIKTDNLTGNYYVAVPITKVTMKIVNGSSTDLTSAKLAQGYDILTPLLNDNGRVADKTYIYQIYDASNKSLKTPTRAYSISVNTDKTGLSVYYENSSGEVVPITQYASQTSEDLTSIVNYYQPVSVNGKLYLTLSDLHHEETLGAYVDLVNGGLVCYYYELILNGEKNSYEYSETGTLITLNFSNISVEQEEDCATV
jgi:hypothetical protein